MRNRLLPLGFILPAAFAVAADLGALLPERLRSVVAVEFTIQTEVDRRQIFVSGTVIDESGTVIMPGNQILPGNSPDQLRDFKIYRPGSDEAAAAAYLGQDALTGFHFLRVNDAKMIAELKSVTSFAHDTRAPRQGEELWGIGLRGKDEDFVPYILRSPVAMIARLPNETALTAQDIGAPGLPVFDREGRLAGLALNSFGQNFLLFSRNQHGTPIVLVNAEESSVVLLAAEFLPHLKRVPQSVSGRPVAAFGAYGIQPVDPDVAKLLKLERRSGLVLSDIMEGSPAAKAGLQDRDIVLGLDGQPLPRLKPDRVLVGYFGQEILRRQPGDRLRLAILRGTEQREFEVVLGDEPKMVREAERRYFSRLGFTAREFLAADSILHRAKTAGPGGAVVHFLKPDSPAATAGLRPDDWIREVDGTPVQDFAEAVARLAAIEADDRRGEFVLLTSRGGETQVLRVKLN
ncbi:MAG: signal protein PDZ [Opitutus sp.]|nr:signal protein PDZ [Opitutus sp.]